MIGQMDGMGAGPERVHCGVPVLLDPLECHALRVFPFDPFVLVEYGDKARVWSTGGELPRSCGGPLPAEALFPVAGADGSAALLELDLGARHSRTWTPPWERPTAWTPAIGRPERLSSLAAAMLDGRRVLLVGGLDGSCSVWELAAGEHRYLPDLNSGSRPVERVLTGGPEQRPLAVFGTSRWGWDDFTESTLEFFFAAVYDVALGLEVFQVPCLGVDLVYALGTAGTDWLLAVATEDEGTVRAPAHAVRLFDAVTGTPIGRRLPPTGEVMALAVGRCAGRPAVASAGREGDITVWDAMDGQVTLRTRLDTEVSDLAFVPGGGILLATETGLRFLSLTA
jgi:hypothetical protein